MKTLTFPIQMTIVQRFKLIGASVASALQTYVSSILLLLAAVHDVYGDAVTIYISWKLVNLSNALKWGCTQHGNISCLFLHFVGRKIGFKWSSDRHHVMSAFMGTS